jgi:tetratricopeptide (TPR) repeat protein
MRAATLLLLGLFACKGAPDRAVRTTDGAIALSNLDAQIEGQEQLLRREPSSVMTASALIELLQARAQYAGRVSDFDRASEIAERVVRLNPADPGAYLARASNRAALHQFPGALADLDKAGNSDAAQGLRASILQAQGKLDQAIALRTALVARHRNTQSVGALAAAQGSEALFDEAAKLYRDTSPFPLAWLDFQRGLMREKSGDLDGASQAYSQAVARLPQYAQAQAHLAGIEALRGEKRKAEERLNALAKLDDPEYRGQLAALLQDEGLRDSAKRSYEALLSRHPEAFADHAARFYLAFDPHRALALAEENLAVRETWDAWDLALTAASEAGEPRCDLASRALSRPKPPPRIQRLAHGCP